MPGLRHAGGVLGPRRADGLRLPDLPAPLMQTFLPYADFARCAAVLDPRRLGKQRVEVLQIMRAITVPGLRLAPPPGGQAVEGLRGGAGRLRRGRLPGVVPAGPRRHLRR